MGYTKWKRPFEYWMWWLYDVKSGKTELKNMMYGSVIGLAKAFLKRANLADTFFFGLFIPIIAVIRPTFEHGLQSFILLLFLTTKIQGKLLCWNKPNDLVPLFANKLDILFQNCLISCTFIEVVVNIFLLLFRLRSINICECFPPLTGSKMNKIRFVSINK